MTKLRGLLKKFVFCLRRLPIHAQKKITAFQRGRGTVKYALFYRYTSYFVFLQALVALAIGLAMLWPSHNNNFFDFHATSEVEHTPTTGGDVCSVDFHTIFEFWKGFQNYSVLAQILFSQVVLFFLSSAMMFLLSLAYRHFSFLEREKFANVSFSTKWLGWFVKTFPTHLRVIYILLFAFLVIPFCLFFFGSTCEVRVPAMQNIHKIHNCRRWILQCAGDKRLFGRQLECSKIENYRMFPSTICGTGTMERACYFPIPGSHDFAKTTTICGGVSHAHPNIGPVPVCPVCTDAREDKRTKVYMENYRKMAAAHLQTAPKKETVVKSFLGEADECPTSNSCHPCPASSFKFSDFFLRDMTPRQAMSSKRIDSIPITGVAQEPPRRHSYRSSFSQRLNRLKRSESHLSMLNAEGEPTGLTSSWIDIQSYRIGSGVPVCSHEGAFENAYRKATFLMQQGSYVGRVLYAWSFFAFMSFCLVRLLGWYIHSIVVEDPSFFTPAEGGVFRRTIHSFFKGIGL